MTESLVIIDDPSYPAKELAAELKAIGFRSQTLHWSDEPDLSALTEVNPTVIVVALSSLAGTTNVDHHLRRWTRANTRPGTESSKKLPRPLLVIKSIAGWKRGARHNRVIIITVMQHATLPFMQILHRHGVDWVWSGPLTADFTALLRNLRKVRDDLAARTRPRVLIVENSPAVCRQLRARLQKTCDVDIVGEMLPDTDRDIDIAEAFDVFARTQYDAVVVDLALTAAAESEANSRYRLPEEVSAVIAQLPDANQRRTLLSLLSGLELIRQMRMHDSEALIVALSNYLEQPQMLSVIRAYLGSPIVDSVEWKAKTTTAIPAVAQLILGQHQEVRRVAR